jgi:hypothetical protein
MILIPRTKKIEGARGHWAVGLRRRVMIWCPKCGMRSYLDHEIAGDGTVTPSVVCPWRGCDWHVHVKLDKWEPFPAYDSSGKAI